MTIVQIIVRFQPLLSVHQTKVNLVFWQWYNFIVDYFKRPTNDAKIHEVYIFIQLKKLPETVKVSNWYNLSVKNCWKTSRRKLFSTRKNFSQVFPSKHGKAFKNLENTSSESKSSSCYWKRYNEFSWPTKLKHHQQFLINFLKHVSTTWESQKLKLCFSMAWTSTSVSSENICWIFISKIRDLSE